MRFASFTKAYVQILRTLLSDGISVSPRNLECTELRVFNWSLVSVEDGLDRLDFSKTGMPERQEVYDRYADAELKWYLSGNLRADTAPSKFWKQIADADGLIHSNYGHMVLFAEKYPVGMTAYQKVVNTLRNDSESRQAIIHYSLPQHHYAGNRDVPCTLCAQLFLRDGTLSMWVTQRSCDVIKGLSYDIPWHGLLMRKLAHELGVKTGALHHTIGSLHLYEKDRATAEKVIQ